VLAAIGPYRHRRRMLRRLIEVLPVQRRVFVTPRVIQPAPSELRMARK
jgi:predicted phosphatase